MSDQVTDPQPGILIVEDARFIAARLKRTLTGLGYDVLETVASGEEALQVVSERRPDLVLMDIALAGELNGVETAAQMRSQFDVPVIYLTAHAGETLLQQAKITEPYGYLVKPVQDRELHAAIETALYRHKLETQLKEKERWLDATLRGIGDAVIATDQHGRVTFMNPVAEELTGWKQTEALGYALTQIFHVVNQATGDAVENLVEQVIREEGIVGLTNHSLLIKKDRTTIPIDDSAAPVRDDKGDISGVVLVFRDITARVRAEEEIQQHREHLEELVQERTEALQIEKEKAQQYTAQLAHALERQRDLDRLRSEFIQNVSHELRTPLAVVRGHIELLETGVLGELQPDQLESVTVSARRLRALSKLVDDITGLLDTEREGMTQDLVDMAGLVQGMLDNFQSTAEQVELTLTVQITPDLPPVLGDPIQLQQTVDNLLDNALKFTPAGGRITVRLEQEGQNLVLEVSDTGIGIPDNQLERIFERFYQVDGSTTRHYGGTGLGLALVKESVEAHEGQVTVQSVLREGSTFSVTLPICPISPPGPVSSNSPMLPADDSPRPTPPDDSPAGA